MLTKKWVPGFIFFAFMCSFIQADASCHKKHVKYVQGGLCEAGEGSKRHPFNSLADAEADTSWNVLVVLPSTTPLDGGITLRPKTKLIGASFSPTDIALNVAQPTITNTTDARNGGNGVVVTGDAVIENIYFKNTWSSAINFNQGRDLIVKNVLVTGHNQGAVFSPISLPNGEIIEVAGIHGQPTECGKTIIDEVIIRNNHTGSGIIDLPMLGAHRKLIVKETEISELTDVNPETNLNVMNVVAGIFCGPQGLNAEQKAIIENIYVHDFLPQAVANEGVFFLAAEGGKGEIEVVDSIFDHIHNNSQLSTIHIHIESVTTDSFVLPGIKSEVKALVNGCSFQEPEENITAPVSAVLVETTNSITDWLVKGNTVTNVYDNFVSSSDGIEKGAIIGNKGTGNDAFFLIFTSDQSAFGNPQRISKIFIRDNNFVGGNDRGAIAVVPNIDDTTNNNPWDLLRIYANNNCFDGAGRGFAGLYGNQLGIGSGAGNAAIIAHENSIVDFTFDISDIGANVSYFAQRNWWGPAGPDNINISGTSFVDVSDPLTRPIICPNSCNQ